MTLLQSFLRAMEFSVLAGLGAGNQAAAQDQPVADSGRGKTFFQTSCAACHTTSLGPGNTVIVIQGPSLVAVVGASRGFRRGFQPYEILE